jgi:hypothetical protein
MAGASSQTCIVGWERLFFGFADCGLNEAKGDLIGV